jgi:hypothetical protein
MDLTTTHRHHHHHHYCCYSSLGSLHLLLDEQEIVSHEAKSAMYPISAYYMAKQVRACVRA